MLNKYLVKVSVTVSVSVGR